MAFSELKYRIDKQETKTHLLKNRTPHKFRKQDKEWKAYVGFITKYEVKVNEQEKETIKTKGFHTKNQSSGDWKEI